MCLIVIENNNYFRNQHEAMSTNFQALLTSRSRHTCNALQRYLLEQLLDNEAGYDLGNQNSKLSEMEVDESDSQSLPPIVKRFYDNVEFVNKSDGESANTWSV